jgi:hypothetical protein
MNRGQGPGLELPLQVEGLDREWLSQALAEAAPGAAVIRAERLETLWGTGTKVLFEVAYNAAGQAAGLPTRLWVKGGFAEHREAMLFLYQLEARFFREIAPQLDIRTPRRLFAGASADQGIVVLEDLHQAGAEICRVQQPLDFDQAAAFLDALAAMHARWWNSPDLDDPQKLGWLQRHDPLPDDDWGAYGRGQLQPDTWARYMQLPRALALPKRFRDREAMHAALQALRRVDAQGPTCLIHADAHLGNLFIDADGRPGFLDWQSVRRGHWAQDVTYFMISALDPLDRRAWDRALVEGYLEGLRRRGVQGPPDTDEAWAAIRAHIVYGLFYWMVNPVEWQAEVNNCAVAPRFAWAAVDHHAPPH